MEGLSLREEFVGIKLK